MTVNDKILKGLDARVACRLSSDFLDFDFEAECCWKGRVDRSRIFVDNYPNAFQWSSMCICIMYFTFGCLQQDEHCEHSGPEDGKLARSWNGLPRMMSSVCQKALTKHILYVYYVLLCIVSHHVFWLHGASIAPSRFNSKTCRIG